MTRILSWCEHGWLCDGCENWSAAEVHYTGAWKVWPAEDGRSFAAGKCDTIEEARAACIAALRANGSWGDFEVSDDAT